MIDADEDVVASSEPEDDFIVPDFDVFGAMNNPQGLRGINFSDQLGTLSPSISVLGLDEAAFFSSYSDRAQHTDEQQIPHHFEEHAGFFNHYMALVQRFSMGQDGSARIRFEPSQIILLMQHFSETLYHNLKIISENEAFFLFEDLNRHLAFDLVFSAYFAVNFSLIQDHLDFFKQRFSVIQHMSMLTSQYFCLNFKIFSTHYHETSMTLFEKRELLYDFLVSPVVSSNHLLMVESLDFNKLSSELRAVVLMSPNLTNNWFAAVVLTISSPTNHWFELETVASGTSDLLLKSSESQLQTLLSSDYVVQNLKILEQYIPFFRFKITRYLKASSEPTLFIDALLCILARPHDLNEKLAYLKKYFSGLIKEELSIAFLGILNNNFLCYFARNLRLFSTVFDYTFNHQALQTLLSSQTCDLVILFIDNAMAERKRLWGALEAFIKTFKAHYSVDKVFELLTQPLTEETVIFLETHVFPPLPVKKISDNKGHSFRFFEQQKASVLNDNLQNSNVSSLLTRGGFL